MAFISQSSPTSSVSADTETEVYDGTTNNSGSGAPTAGAVVVGLAAANIGTVSAYVDIYKRSYLNSAGTGESYIIKGVLVPPGSTLDALPGKVVLNSGDIIYMKTSVADSIQVTASLLEN